MKWFCSFSLIFCFSFLFSQEKSEIEGITIKGELDSLQSTSRNPMKAALYSAILPGAGQYYNHKLWKVPIVWAALGTGIGFVFFYDNQYKTYRDAYIHSLNGEPHEFSDISGFTTEILAGIQDDQRRNRDYAIVISSVIYLLNIVEALVDAHLSDINKDKDLAVKPVFIHHPISQKQTAGIGLQFNF